MQLPDHHLSVDPTHEKWMLRALELADIAAEQGEVPVGALVVRGDEILGEGWNQMISSSDPTAHAEVVAMRAASQATGNYRLPETTLYVTLEPCTMCAGAIIHARIKTLVFGAFEPKSGVICSRCELTEQPWYNHNLVWFGGVRRDESKQKLQDFFRARRNTNS